MSNKGKAETVSGGSECILHKRSVLCKCCKWFSFKRSGIGKDEKGQSGGLSVINW
jgi:hypothetical protein